jgi:hypothetical protein
MEDKLPNQIHRHSRRKGKPQFGVLAHASHAIALLLSRFVGSTLLCYGFGHG